MFGKTFSVMMTPAFILMGIVSPIIYFWAGIDMAASGDTLAAVLWFVVWGHILSALIAAILILPAMALLALLAGAAAYLVSLAFGLQKKGIENLPFNVTRKE